MLILPPSCRALVILLCLSACGAETDPEEEGEESIVQGLAPAGSDARALSAPIRPSWAPGERDIVSITMQNTGSIPWPGENYALKSLDRQWDWRYETLTAPVATGSSYTFDVAVTAPTAEGAQSFAARMVALGLGEFGESLLVPTSVSTSATPHWGCRFVPESSDVPTALAPGENRTVTLTVQNTGSGTWGAGFSLASKDTPASLWYQTNAPLNDTVAPGANETFRFSIRAPSLPGTYAFRREMHDSNGLGDFRRSNFCVDLAIPVTGSAPLASSLATQDFPTLMQPGERAVVSVSMTNTGSEPWQADGNYVLNSLNSPRSLWGATIVEAPRVVLPGEAGSFSFRIAAPSTSGSYAQRWQMRKLNGAGAGLFGAVVNVPVSVSTDAIPRYGATVVSQSVPERMTAGKLYTLQARIRNSGSRAWEGADFSLISQNSPKLLWGTGSSKSSLAVGETIAPQATRTFSIELKAPDVAGTYAGTWRMSQANGVGPFGEAVSIANIQVTRCGDGRLDDAEACDDGNLVDGDGCSMFCQRECGDGVAGPGEDCDGNDLRQATCESATGGQRPLGTLSCSATCTFDKSACTPVPSRCSGDVAFNDPVLEQRLREALNKPEGPITAEDAAELTQFHVYGSGGSTPIRDLKGLECFTNLSLLHLVEQDVSDLSPIAGLVGLTELWIGGSNLTDVTPLAALSQLGTLDLADNSIDDLAPLAGLSNLWTLYLDHNLISDVTPLAGLPELTELSISFNQLNDISPLAGLVHLINVQLSYNQISEISALSGMTGLNSVWLDENLVTDIAPLGLLSDLRELLIFGNQVQSIAPLANCSMLTYLDAGNNHISDLSALSAQPFLSELYLSMNAITSIKPLVDNPGVGNGDSLLVSANPLDCAGEARNISALLARGVNFQSDCP